MEFNIENYLNSLDENTEVIDVSFKNLKYLPDLSRFKKLKELNCSYNKLTFIHSLNKTLKKLVCDYNYLTFLPILNEELEKLYCSYNQLTFLPILRENLKIINCSHNKLSSLPTINKKLKIFIFYNNRIHETIKECGYKVGYKFGLNTDDVEITKKIIKILNNFRYVYYLIKLKKKFRNWLWVRVREPKIRNKYNPKYLLETLDENKDLDDFLDNW